MTVFEMIDWLTCFGADDEVYIRVPSMTGDDDIVSEEYHFEERMDGAEIVLEVDYEGIDNSKIS